MNILVSAICERIKVQHFWIVIYRDYPVDVPSDFDGLR